MPKPVLSDSLFNAEDVAEAILNKANLSIANENLGKTRLVKGTDYILKGGWSQSYDIFVAFNGIMFVSFSCSNQQGGSQGEACIEMLNTNYFPVETHVFPSVSYQGDSLWQLRAETNGLFTIHEINNLGTTTFFVNVNGFYRYA